MTLHTQLVLFLAPPSRREQPGVLQLAYRIRGRKLGEHRSLIRMDHLMRGARVSSWG